jgi:hypothetical protein
VIDDKLPKGGKLVGTGRIGVVTIKFLGAFLCIINKLIPEIESKNCPEFGFYFSKYWEIWLKILPNLLGQLQ